ncbi:MAG: SIR2 family protein [Pseudomonadota bacterium]
MNARQQLEQALRGVADGRIVPYLGAAVAGLGTGLVPASPAALAAVIEAAVRVPRRASGNLWAAAQFVETRRRRRTVAALVERAFAAPTNDNPIHGWLAKVRPPLVVDAWYDTGLLDAFAASSAAAFNWGWVEGVSRHDASDDAWTRAFDRRGFHRPKGPDPAWSSFVYKPHGCARAGSSFLLSDSDYVQVLTEIDIQTPIPVEVRQRRRDRGFLFLGTRFDDQLLRIFARQIMKRSRGPHVAVLDGPLTRMEGRFLEAQNIERIDLDLVDVAAALRVAA